MADCSAAGTTIDRAARAVIGGTTTSSSIFGHASMFPATAAATAANTVFLPTMSPDHLVVPSESQGHQMPSIDIVPLTSVHETRHRNQQHLSNTKTIIDINRNSEPGLVPSSDMMIYSAAVTRNQSVQLQQHQQQHQAMMTMHQQQQQYQHAMMMMQQQQQFQIRQHHQLEQSKLELETKITQQKLKQQKDIEDNWHRGLEEEFFQEARDISDDVVFNDDIVNNIDGAGADGASIEELAAAWAEAEDEYDNTLLNHEYEEEQQQWQDQYAHEMNNELLNETDYANMLQGNGGDLSLTNREDNHITSPYEFANIIGDGDFDVADAISNTSEKKNYMKDGMKQFQEGNLKVAIASFEMELQLNNMDNATAWRMLGKCHAENDQDLEAIQSLEAAVDRDPFCPETLLALGVSYVNELNHERALDNMKAWLTHNSKYAGMDFITNINNNNIITKENDIYGAASSSSLASATVSTTEVEAEAAVNVATESHRNTKESAFDEVKQMLLAALEFDPTDAGDIYEVLGVIYNVIKDYDKAVESFRKALEIRPDDYQLWNKLGATLANGSQSDQALPMYHQSLKIKPRYARAWLNMAISHSNLQDHDEAARCYLQTLSLNPGATHCWTYLRMSLSSQERWDCLPLVFERNLSGFQKHFDFVLY